MPAIQPQRLQRQSAELAAMFISPGKFIRELEHLLEYYADRAKPSEETETSHTELTSFKPPAQLMNHIRTELQPLIQAHHQKAFELAQALWEYPIHEARILATYVLGTIPFNSNAPQSEPIQAQLLDHLSRWVITYPDDDLLIRLAEDGLASWRNSDPDMLLGQIEVWLINDKTSVITFGLLALKFLLNDPNYENLPRVFNIISPLVIKIDQYTRAELRRVVIACARRSANETVKFLEKSATNAEQRSFKWLIRNCSSYFPDEYSGKLRKLLSTVASA